MLKFFVNLKNTFLIFEGFNLNQKINGQNNLNVIEKL